MKASRHDTLTPRSAHGVQRRQKGTVNQLGFQSGNGHQETHGDLTGISDVKISTISFTLSWHSYSYPKKKVLAMTRQLWKHVASGDDPPESKFDCSPIAGRRSTSGDSFEFHRLFLPWRGKFIRDSMSGKQR